MGYQAVEDRHYYSDLHATLLHQLGIRFLPELGPVSLLVEEGNGPIRHHGLKVQLSKCGREENDQGHQPYGDRRPYSGPSFHCLRHTLSSFLGNSGASQGVAGDIVAMILKR